MPTLTHSPARIVKQVLLDLGLCADPEDAVPPAKPADWSVYANKKPPQFPDRAVWVVNVAGQDDGRSQMTGELFQHYGFTLGVRGRTAEEAWARVALIRTGLAEDATGLGLAVDGTEYLVNAVTRIGQPVYAGPEPGSERVLYTLSATLSVSYPDLTSGLLLEVQAGVGMKQDDARAVPVTTTGQTLRAWEDQSGRDNHLTSPDRPPTVTLDGGVLVYQGSSSRAMWAALGSTTSRARVTVYFLARLGSATFGTNPAVSFARFSPDGQVAPCWNGQDQQFYLSSQNTTPTSGSNTPSGQATAYAELAWTRDGTAVKMYQDGFLVNEFTATDGAFSVTDLVLGGWSENAGAHGFWGANFPERVLEASVLLGTHSAAQVRAHAARSRTRYPTLYGLRDPLVVFWGNSLPQGYLQWGTPSFVYKVGTALGLAHWYNRSGMTGSGTGVGTQSMLESVDQFLEVLRCAEDGANAVAFLQEITNDVRVNGLTGAQAAANVLELCTRVRDGGFRRVVVATAPPCADAGFNAARGVANPLVRSGYLSAGATQLCDWDTDAALAADGAELGANYEADHLHWTAAGHTRAAAVAQVPLAAALA